MKVLDEHVSILENTATQHSVHIEKSQNDIQSLFNKVKHLEDNQKPNPDGALSAQRDDESNMEVDADKMIDESCVLIRNMAQRTRNTERSQVNCDEEDIHALFFLGLNISDIIIKSFRRNDPKTLIQAIPLLIYDKLEY